MTGIRNRCLALLLLLLPFLVTGCVDRPTPTQPGPGAVNALAAVTATSAEAILGRAIFFDQDLSLNRNESCASCHGPEAGFKGPNSAVNAHGAVYEGSVPGRFGNRAPPSAAYATTAPIFQFVRQGGGVWLGGNFWDGRATGAQLGNPAAEQARGPFLNPAEQALPDLACVVWRVSTASYAGDFTAVWGDEVTKIQFPADIATVCATEGTTVSLAPADRARAVAAYDQIAFSIAAFEGSPEVNAFGAKFDAARRGGAKLTAEEQRGRALFQGKAKCVRCHPDQGQQPLFTDYSYDNLGVPANPENPVYVGSSGYVDLGLGGPGGALPGEEQWGMMKVPTLRNVAAGAPALAKAYMHNGVFKSLKEVVHFYNTRDALPVCPAGTPRAQWGATCWPAPEVSENVNRSELGDLGLTGAEEDAIVAYLETLTDGWAP